MNVSEKILTKAGLHSSYWGKKIIAAEKRGRFTESNIRQAGTWTTCACGRQDQRIPRYKGSKNDPWSCVRGEPKDHDLANLGMDFGHEVEGGYFSQAAMTLIDIERRAAQILMGLEQ